MNISRRALLGTIPLASVAAGLALAGCATSTVNGVTTITVNLAALNAYAQAIENGANTLLSISLVTDAMGAATTALVKTAIADAATSIAALDTANAGKVSFSFTLSSVPAALAALQGDASTIGNSATTVVKNLGSQASASVTTTVDAIQTVVSVLTSLVSGAVGAPLKSNVDQALSVLGVKAPN